MMKERLVKLVRDRVDKFVGGEHRVEYRTIIDHDEYIRQLRRKLIEEAIEYLEEPSADELADVLEVVQTLAAVDVYVPWATIAVMADEKRRQRGGFMAKTGMFIVADDVAP